MGGGGVLAASSSGGRSIPAKIELLTFGKLGKGMKILGVVREVREEYAVVSLPTMLMGFVRREEVSFRKEILCYRGRDALKMCELALK